MYYISGSLWYFGINHTGYGGRISKHFTADIQRGRCAVVWFEVYEFRNKNIKKKLEISQTEFHFELGGEIKLRIRVAIREFHMRDLEFRHHH